MLPWWKAKPTRRSAVQAANFSSGVGQIVDIREWTFINPEISLYFFRPPEGEWILDGFGNAPPVEAILQLTHSLVNGRRHVDTLRCS